MERNHKFENSWPWIFMHWAKIRPSSSSLKKWRLRFVLIAPLRLPSEDIFFRDLPASDRLVDVIKVKMIFPAFWIQLA